MFILVHTEFEVVVNTDYIIYMCPSTLQAHSTFIVMNGEDNLTVKETISDIFRLIRKE